MMRMTAVLRLSLSLVSLSACGNLPPVDLCKHAAVRRQIYVTTIEAADAFTASGRPVPAAVPLGREAAATALSILDLSCPALKR